MAKKQEALLQEALIFFNSVYDKDKPSIAVYAPGRVNLIGEHTDYNDGYVLPMAIECCTIIVGHRVDGDICQVSTSSEDVDEPKHIKFSLPSIDCPLKSGQPKWSNYFKGVLSVFSDTFPAFNAIIVSTVPVGGGLSSSASIEVATYTFLEALTGKVHDPKFKALACQRAEHEFPKVPCGIMDQFISVMGKKNHALLIDCRSMEGKLVSLDNADVVVVIANTNVKHELTGSEYGERRKQCEEAAMFFGKNSLRDVTYEELLQKKDKLDHKIFRRAHHVISEIDRTKEAAASLERGDYDLFGKLMVESHNSLRDDYEVSCDELDLFVKLALEVDGVYGSRMTGAGFGGCTVTLVKQMSIDNLIKHIQEGYHDMANIFISKPSDGARILEL